MTENLPESTKKATSRKGGKKRIDAEVTRANILACVLRGLKARQIAEELNLAQSTVYGYLQDESFRDEVRNLQTEALESLARRTTIYAEDALQNIHRVMQNDTTPANVVVTAGKALIEAHLKVLEIAHLQEELDALKKAVEARELEGLEA